MRIWKLLPCQATQVKKKTTTKIRIKLNICREEAKLLQLIKTCPTTNETKKTIRKKDLLRKQIMQMILREVLHRWCPVENWIHAKFKSKESDCTRCHLRQARLPDGTNLPILERQVWAIEAETVWFEWLEIRYPTTKIMASSTIVKCSEPL